MQILINISKDDFEEICMQARMVEDSGSLFGRIRKAISHSTPIPSGHGKIGDLDKVADRLEELRDGWNYYGNEFESGMYKGYDYALDEVMDAPTIIEKDGEVES